MKRCLVLLAGLLFTGMARAATVQVTVTGVRGDAGHILIALCTRADFLRPHCAWKAKVLAREGVVTATIPGVPPGVYAAQAFHDENDDGKLGRSLLGLPREAMGFSKDAPMRRGPPRFNDAAFTVGAADIEVAFSLRYF